jgi:hypothetical protein
MIVFKISIYILLFIISILYMAISIPLMNYFQHVHANSEIMAAFFSGCGFIALLGCWIIPVGAVTISYWVSID